MEKKTRLLIKALTWQLIGFVVMTAVNYVYMGSLQAGLGLSAILTAIGVVSYYCHERIWARIGWGRM